MNDPNISTKKEDAIIVWKRWFLCYSIKKLFDFATAYIEIRVI